MSFSRLLVFIGLMFLIAGVSVAASNRWPFLPRLGHLPGDLRVQGKHGNFYFPWVTCLLLSLVLSLLLRLFQGIKK